MKIQHFDLVDFPSSVCIVRPAWPHSRPSASGAHPFQCWAWAHSSWELVNEENETFVPWWLKFHDMCAHLKVPWYLSHDDFHDVLMVLRYVQLKTWWTKPSKPNVLFRGYIKEKKENTADFKIFLVSPFYQLLPGSHLKHIMKWMGLIGAVAPVFILCLVKEVGSKKTAPTGQTGWPISWLISYV